MDVIKYQDLKCEHCDGNGEKEKFVEPYGDSPITCTFCNGTGIDQDQLRKLNQANYLCQFCGCSHENHNQDGYCPSFWNGQFFGWLETKFYPSVGVV